MGWLYGWYNREELVNHLLGDRNHKVLAHKATAYGKRLWVVYRPTWEGRESDEPYICLFLLERDARSDTWGYKDITESMGPCEHDCPLELLDLAPEPSNQWAAEWRAQVRAYHADRRRTYRPGDRVTIYGSPYVVTGKIKRSYTVRRMLSDGTPYGDTYRASTAKMRPALAEGGA